MPYRWKTNDSPGPSRAAVGIPEALVRDRVPGLHLRGSDPGENIEWLAFELWNSSKVAERGGGCIKVGQNLFQLRHNCFIGSQKDVVEIVWWFSPKFD